MKVAGIYAGSFNPFHVGHLDIAEKAKRIFSRVFIVQAQNPDKKDKQLPLPVNVLEAKGFICVSLEPEDLLTSFIHRIEHNHDVYGAYSQFDQICVIRGMRNTYDFVYEQNLHDAYRRFKPDINIIHLFSRPELNFVSSTLLRKHGKDPAMADLIVQ